MLEFGRRTQRIQSAEIHEQEITNGLAAIYEDASRFLETTFLNMKKPHVLHSGTLFGPSFRMTDPREVPSGRRSIHVRLGLERNLLGLGKPRVLVDCQQISDSTPHVTHSEQYVLSQDGTLQVFTSDAPETEWPGIPPADLRDRATLVKQAVGAFTALYL